jgi:hypothetical protein
MNKSILKQIIKEEISKKLNTNNTSSDVVALDKAYQNATNVRSKAKVINTIPEFPGAFETWFKTLGFEPGKISKGVIRSEVEKVLTMLGYK